MYEVFGEDRAEITANGARCSRARIRGTHHCANDLPRVLGTLQHHCHDGSTRHERHQIRIETFALMLGVVIGERVGVQRSQLHGRDTKALSLESGDDLPHQMTLDGIGFEQDEGSRVFSGLGHGPRLPLRHQLVEHGSRGTHDVQRSGDQ
jgi:hypothetical protein